MRITTTWLGRTLAAAAALGCITAAPVRGDVAATGRFTVSVEPDLDVDGSLDFDPGQTDVLGRLVDLKATVGRMRLAGVITDFDLQARSASFQVTLSTSSPGGALLDLAGSGNVFCVEPNCAGGAATLIAVLSVVNDPQDVLPDGAALTFDATGALDVVSLIPLTVEGAGVFGINAFPAIPTPAGSAVMVSSGPETFFDSRQASVSSYLIELLFDAVQDDGATLFIGLSAARGALPAGIELDVGGFDSSFVDVVTTAVFSGPVLACFAYADATGDGIVDGTTVAAQQLRVLHRTSPLGAFVDVTTMLDPALRRVCGTVSTLSTFVVGVGPVPPSTTTTTVTTSTTTTTTLPACLDDATFDSILCRLDALIAAVEAGNIGEPTKSNLLNTLRRARARVVDAQERVDDGRIRGAKSKLKSAIRKLTSAGFRLRSLSGRRRVPAELRAELGADANAIRQDLRALLRTL